MESGRASVRDITAEVMDMRARAAASAGGGILNPFVGLSLSGGAAHFAPFASPPPGPSSSSSPSASSAGGPFRGLRPQQHQQQGTSFATSMGALGPPSAVWQGASSDSILSKMHGERLAVSNLMSNYSSWLQAENPPLSFSSLSLSLTFSFCPSPYI